MNILSSASQVLAQPNGRWDYHDRGFPWVWGPLMVLFGLGLIALVVWLIVRFARPHVRSGLHRARELLAERYARGEINSEEYDERMNRLKD